MSFSITHPQFYRLPKSTLAVLYTAGGRGAGDRFRFRFQFQFQFQLKLTRQRASQVYEGDDIMYDDVYQPEEMYDDYYDDVIVPVEIIIAEEDIPF